MITVNVFVLQREVEEEKLAEKKKKWETLEKVAANCGLIEETNKTNEIIFH